MKRAREMSGAKSRRFPTKLLSYSVLSLSLARGKMASSGRPRAYLDVAVGSAPPARLVVELRPDFPPTSKKGVQHSCTSLAWSADGATLYTGYTDGVIRVWGVNRAI